MLDLIRCLSQEDTESSLEVELESNLVVHSYERTANQNVTHNWKAEQEDNELDV